MSYTHFKFISYTSCITFIIRSKWLKKINCFSWGSVRKTGILYNFMQLFGCIQITMEPGGVKGDQPSVFNFAMFPWSRVRVLLPESWEPAGNCCWLHSFFTSWDEWMAGDCTGCWKTYLCKADASGGTAGGRGKWLLPPLLLSDLMLMHLTGKT